VSKPAPSSVLSGQSATIAAVDRILDDPLPDLGAQLPGLASYYNRDWATGPLLTLGRQIVRPPGSDDPLRGRWYRMAAEMMSLAHEAAAAERMVDACDPDDEPTLQSSSPINRLEMEICLARSYSAVDREKLNEALRDVLYPLLPQTHDELFAWVVDHTAPAQQTPARTSRSKNRKGKNIDSQMLTVMAEKNESYGGRPASGRRIWTAPTAP
jgi:hypothetical protein